MASPPENSKSWNSHAKLQTINVANDMKFYKNFAMLEMLAPRHFIYNHFVYFGWCVGSSYDTSLNVRGTTWTCICNTR